VPLTKSESMVEGDSEPTARQRRIAMPSLVRIAARLVVTPLILSSVVTVAPVAVRRADAAPPFQLYMPVPWGAVVKADGPHSMAGSADPGGVRNSVDIGPLSGSMGVHAAATGTAHVESGCLVRIDHDIGGWQTKYLHLKNLVPGLNGKRVIAGERIGDAGTPAETCGSGTAVHVHFALYQNGSPVAIDGTSIGGYTVHQSGDMYCGYWTRDTDGATVINNVSQPCEMNSARTLNNNLQDPAVSTDNDGDGIPDTNDKCPTEKGESGDEGCEVPLSIPIDVNGDGRTDLVHRYNNAVNTWLSNGDGHYSIAGQAQVGYDFGGGTWMTADVNGDGRTDLVHRYVNTINTWISNGNGSWTIVGHQAQAGYGYTDGVWRVGDVNGDGRTDLVHRWSGGVNTWLSNGDGHYSIAGQAQVGYDFGGGNWPNSQCCRLPRRPDAPSAVHAVAGAGSATVTWLPTSTGGSPIVDYTVIAAPGGASRTVAGPSAEFTGLSNGTSYSFAVTARNRVGASPVTVSNAVTPATVPLAPSSPLAVSGRAGDGSVLVSWAAPVSDGGSAVSGYRVTVLPGGGVRSVAGTSSTFTGLSNGTSYTFRVAAVNAVGAGPDAVVSATPLGSLPPVPAVSLESLVPGRLLESRSGASTVDGQANGIGLRPAGSVTELQVTGRHGVPGDASAVVLNVTVTGAQGDGFVTVWPCGTPMPNASSLNFVSGQTIPNAVITKIGAGGKVCLFTTAATFLLADINGFYPVGSSFSPLVPGRLLESRPGATTIDGVSQGIGLRPAGSITDLQVTGRHGVPADAAAAVLNVTVTGAQGDGFVTVWPCGTPMPNASSLNFVSGQTIPNAVITKIGTGGKVCLFTTAATFLLSDINGYETA
jgi:hypothetical protein